MTVTSSPTTSPQSTDIEQGVALWKRKQVTGMLFLGGFGMGFAAIATLIVAGRDYRNGWTGSLWALIPTCSSRAPPQRELPGDREYAQRTRYRLLPGVW